MSKKLLKESEQGATTTTISEKELTSVYGAESRRTPSACHTGEFWW